MNFIHNFKITKKSRIEKPLECLNGKNVHKIITEYSQPRYKKSRLHILSEIHDDILQAFPKDKLYYVYPRFKYNIIVDTKKHTPNLGAEVVLNNLKL